MSHFFFQKYWDLVGVEVSNAVISFLTTKDMSHDLNYTNVVLIPKVKEVQHMTELRLIALCNVVYKIASKVLANMLKIFLAYVISLEQSVFVLDRLISDNTLVAAELAHYMHKLRREGLSALISNSVDQGHWRGLQVVRNIMNMYEAASGQQVDLQKSSVVFIGSVPLQGWMLLQNPTSLPGRLLKAIYFSHNNFWEAELGNAQSYAWQSIIDGRDVLRQGVSRQIGDGQRTNIWYDPWLKGEELLQFRSPSFNKVSDLLLSPGVWNVGVLQELFPASIVSKILALLISSREYQDRWIWSEDKLGKFSVKTAYHLARKHVLDHEHVPNPNSLLWNKIWKAKVSGKVKVCAWKLPLIFFPLEVGLVNRVWILTPTALSVRRRWSHLLCSENCFHATEYLQLAQVPLLPNNTSESKGLRGRLGEVKQASKIVSLALGWWENYKKARSSLIEPRIVFRSRWTKPSIGFVKLNVDAAFDPNSERSGLGGVFRDHEGFCLGAFTKFIVSASSPQHSELLAVLEGVGWA
uniref:uncharacterized protein LOC105350808 n=1 Tax=Fragaria vesca subsp. vesca TaxID=101020 RepID=UPI0005CB4B9B|nr:PREDICTED: uncharacterized protein LOC105350808 [Fragaria vesca subsp. vesca]